MDTSAAEKIPGGEGGDADCGRRLRYEGQPVAAVAATTPEIAEDAIRGRSWWSMKCCRTW